MTQRQRNLVRPKIQGQQQMLHQGGKRDKRRRERRKSGIPWPPSNVALKNRIPGLLRNGGRLLDSERATSSLLTIGTFSKHGKATEAEPRESPSARNHRSPYCAPLCEGAYVRLQFVPQSAHQSRELSGTVGKVLRTLVKSPFHVNSESRCCVHSTSWFPE